jgi:AraC-like DNA-binding protein
MSQHPQIKRMLSEHQTIQIGRFAPCSAEFASTTPQIHNHGTLIYQVSGHSTMWMGASYRLEARDFLLIPSGVPHRILRAEEAECWGIALCVHCYATLGDGLLQRLFSEISQGACAVRRVEAERQSWIGELLQHLWLEVTQPRLHREEAVRGLLAVLFAEIARAEQASSAENPPMNPLVAQTLRYLEAHALQPISLVDVAAAMKRTTAYLTTLLKQHTGWTVMEWITEFRMNEARRLLLHSDEFIDIIAERIGYASPSHFHQIFRRSHQSTPAAWRRRYQHPIPQKEKSEGSTKIRKI